MSKSPTKAMIAREADHLRHKVSQLESLLAIRDNQIAELRCQTRIDAVRIDVVKTASKLEALKPKYLELQAQGKKPIIRRDYRTGELAVFTAS